MAKDCLRWKITYRDGSKLHQYDYEKVPKEQRRKLDQVFDTARCIELLPTRPHYPRLKMDIPRGASPIYFCRWQKHQITGEIVGCVATIGFELAGVRYLKGVEVNNRLQYEWRERAPRRIPANAMSKMKQIRRGPRAA